MAVFENVFRLEAGIGVGSKKQQREGSQENNQQWKVFSHPGDPLKLKEGAPKNIKKSVLKQRGKNGPPDL